METSIVSAVYVPIQEKRLIILSSFEELKQVALFFKKPIVKHGGSYFVFEAYIYAFLSSKTLSKQVEAPNLDSSFLDKLPWQAYANGKGEWIKANLPEAEKLREELTKSIGLTLTIGNYRYRLQGDKLQFISRRRIA